MGAKSVAILRREKMEITLATLIDLFLATKQTEGKTTKTLSWYRQKLEAFDQFLGGNAPLKEVNLAQARAFIAHLQGKETKFDGHPFRPEAQEGLSAHTVHGYARTLKAFSSWLVEEGFATHDPFAKLKRPKTPKAMIEVLSDDEIASLLASINPNHLMGARLYAAFLTLLDTGIRANELCTLTLDNTHLNEGYLKVFGKGQKERMVPFGATTKKALLRWLITWREALACDGEEAFFLTETGEPLSYSALSQAVKRLGKRAGVERLHCHLLRHTFSVHYLMAGGDIMTLKLMLGHSSLEVTQAYLHLAAAHVQVQHSKFSPVDRLSRRR